MAETNEKKQKRKVPIGWWIFGGLVLSLGVTYVLLNKDKNKNKPKTKGQQDYENLIRTLAPPAKSVITNSTESASQSSASTSKPLPKKTTAPSNPTPPTAAPKATDEFPLKKGSKGPRVKLMQQALGIKDDGDFGPQTEAELKKKGYAVTVDETTFNLIIERNSINAATIASDLFSRRNKPSLEKDLDSLKKMKNYKDYEAVNNEYKDKFSWIEIKSSITNDLLTKYKSDEDKIKIQDQLKRMGLEYKMTEKGKMQWTIPTLTGFSTIITEVPAAIWITSDKCINVPARMVLGTAIDRECDYTIFENSGRQFMVLSKCVRYI